MPAPLISASCPETCRTGVWWRAADTQLPGHSQPTSSSTAGHTLLPMLFQNRKFYGQASIPVYFALPPRLRKPFREAHDAWGAQKLPCSGDTSAPLHGASGPRFTHKEDLWHWQDPSSTSLHKDASPPQLQLPSFTGRPLIHICPPEVTQQQLWEQQLLPTRWQKSREGKSRSHLVPLLSPLALKNRPSGKALREEGSTSNALAFGYSGLCRPTAFPSASHRPGEDNHLLLNTRLSCPLQK